MVDYKVLSENDFKFGTSDYAKSLRKMYGDGGYDNYIKKINSVITEAKKNKELTNPLEVSKKARIAALETALSSAVAANTKARNEYRNLLTHLSGKNITGIQQANLFQKYQTSLLTDMNEDCLRSSLLDEYC